MGFQFLIVKVKYVIFLGEDEIANEVSIPNSKGQIMYRVIYECINEIVSIPNSKGQIPENTGVFSQLYTLMSKKQ